MGEMVDVRDIVEEEFGHLISYASSCPYAGGDISTVVVFTVGITVENISDIEKVTADLLNIR